MLLVLLINDRPEKGLVLPERSDIAALYLSNIVINAVIEIRNLSANVY